MKKLLLLLLLLARPAAGEVCSPGPDQFYDKDQGPLVTRQSNVFLVTHVTRRFDSNPSTIRGVAEAINALSPKFETIYVHTGSFKGYMYPQCKPEWFYKSAGGAIKLDLEATDTVVLIGGYYSLCLRQTSWGVAKAIKDLKVKKDLRLVYVMDATFERMDKVDVFGMQHLGPTFNLSMMAGALASEGRRNEELTRMLTSVYRSEPIPNEYRVDAHLRDHYWKSAEWIEWNIRKGREGGPRIDVYYLESGDLKSFFNL